MESSDITVQILIEIRDELRATNARVDGIVVEMQELRKELAQTRHDLSRRIDQTNRQLVSTETRLVTEISALRATVDVDRDLNNRLERVERDVAELRRAGQP